MQNSPHRIYLSGTGVIAAHHLGHLGDIDWPTPPEIHAFDPNPTALAAFREKFPAVVPHATLADLLAGPAAPGDLVIAASPPRFHAETVSAALNSGRHVLCEKPLAWSSEEAVGLLRLARERGLRLACCSSRFVGTTAFLAAETKLHSGELGPLHFGRMIHRWPRNRTGIDSQTGTRWFYQRAVNGGGVLMDWGPYDFTTLHRLLEPVAATVLSAGYSAPETARVPAECDVEFHVWAAIRYELADGGSFDLSYERASCTHGRGYSETSLEGRLGALTLEWPHNQGVWHGYDEDNVARQVSLYSSEKHEMTSPFVEMIRLLRGQPSASVTDAQAAFNFLVLRAIYDVAESRSPRTIRLADL